MNAVIKASIGRPRLRAALIFVILLLGCFGLLHKAQAVNPPPDGGYPGGNTAEGQAPFLALPRAHTIRRSGGFHLSPLRLAVQHGAWNRGALYHRHQQLEYGYRRRCALQEHWKQQHGQWSIKPFQQYHRLKQHGCGQGGAL